MNDQDCCEDIGDYYNFWNTTYKEIRKLEHEKALKQLEERCKDIDTLLITKN